jgi:hypothetical protein
MSDEVSAGIQLMMTSKEEYERNRKLLAHQIWKDVYAVVKKWEERIDIDVYCFWDQCIKVDDEQYEEGDFDDD